MRSRATIGVCCGIAIMVWAAAPSGAQPVDEPAGDRLEGQVGVEIGFGFAAPGSSAQPAVGPSLIGDMLLTDALGAWARGQFMFSGGAQADADDRSTATFALVATAGVRLWRWEDPLRHNAWSLGIGGGYMAAYHDSRPTDTGPLVELDVTRRLVYRPVAVGFGVRVQQGFADVSDYRAVLGSLHWAHSIGGPPPPLVPRPAPVFRSTFGVHYMPAGVALLSQGRFDGPDFAAGVGLSFGVPIGEQIEPRLRVDLLARAGDSSDHSLSALGGAITTRLRLDRRTPRLFIEAGAGYAATYEDGARDVANGPVADVAFGLRGMPFCNRDSAFELGVRARIGLISDNRGATSLVLTIGYEHASGWPEIKPSHCTSFARLPPNSPPKGIATDPEPQGDK